MSLLLALSLFSSLWETDSLEEFQKGEFKNVALTSKPELRLSREMTRLADLKERLVLCLAADSKGIIYAGTGNDGCVYRVSAGKAESLFAVPTGQVLSLVTDKHDNLFVGTAPQGVIYRIRGSEQEEWFETGQKYVWSLAVGDDDALYAGTGDSGAVFKITGKYAGSVLYDTPEPHITALTWQKDLYAGSSGNGLVYRIKGKEAQVVYKTDRTEVKGLAVEPGGVIYAAANPDPEKSSSDAHPLVYRIRPDGNATILYTSPDSMIFALCHSPSAPRLLVGTGSKARLYEINADTASNDFGASSLILESREGQVLSLLAPRPTSHAPSPVILGTGNGGKVAQLESYFAKEGTYQSRVFDASAISRWGRCFWTGATPLGTGITVATRTGNADKPDDTWGNWQALNGEVVASPPARYIQYQVTLATADNTQTPSLDRLTIAYVQTNLPPAIKTVQVKPSDAGAKRVQTISWEASDPNGDSLCASIYVKGENESDWKLLEKDKAVSKYDLDTDRLPDGWYLVKVRVSDRPSNPLGSELAAEKISPRFLVDNTPPRVDEISATGIGGDKYRLSFVVKDELSLITKCDLSTNVKDWRPVAPESGIFDAQVERFSVELELNKGENVIVVRAQDQAGNTGAGKKIIVAE